ncbi:hypothetical protein NP493_173g03035 [Ridgeia piscesae]|uniref:Uncharacterized protein n=1 Tax=Ridgeia piscesae TaxID=27915 RepID=A0AAD9P2W1_RIDPI|nr:hypothetical protein NP493_173g03035 [Ridgeia piscesae]
MRLLLDGPCSSDVLNAQEDGTGTALFWASVRGYSELVELLLALGAHVGATTRWGATSLHGASDNGHVTVVRKLLHWGADVNAQTQGKDTPCHLAAYRGHTELVGELLAAGANPWLKNCRSLDVVDEAKVNKQTAVHLFLRRFMADQLSVEESTSRQTVYESRPSRTSKLNTSSSTRQNCF